MCRPVTCSGKRQLARVQMAVKAVAIFFPASQQPQWM